MPTPKRSSAAHANSWAQLERPLKILRDAVAASPPATSKLCKGGCRGVPRRTIPDAYRGKSTISPTRQHTRSSKCPRNRHPKSPMPHRGFHDDKNGGFSTIDGNSRNPHYPLPPEKQPPNQQNLF